jgi:cytochrome bd-type quinol oxidase subunit 2
MPNDSLPVGVGGRVRRIGFRVVIGLTTALLVVALLPAYTLIFTDWLPAHALLSIRTDHTAAQLSHRLGSLALGVVAWGMLANVVLQFHRPERKVAALLTALAVPVTLALGEILTGTYTIMGTAPFLLPILAACALHPRAREFIRLPRLDGSMLVLAVAAAVPWILFALGVAETRRALGAGNDMDNHLLFMVSVPLMAALWALIGATDKPGWPFAASAAIVATACVALQSLIWPSVLALAGLRPVWAWAAVVWCLAFGAAAWLRSRRGASPGLESPASP